MSWQQDGEQQVQFQYGAATIQDEICLSPHFDGRHTRLEAKLGINKLDINQDFKPRHDFKHEAE